jgi:hypothetical protein
MAFTYCYKLLIMKTGYRFKNRESKVKLVMKHGKLTLVNN